jgi:hypothetical protein
MSGSDITPVRTREIAQIGGTATGFLDGTRAYGAFGSWRADSASLGLAGDGALTATAPKIGSNDYLWRSPSDFAADATMASNMNLGGHNILHSKFADARQMVMDEFLNAKEVAAGKITFQNRVNLDKDFEAGDTTVSGALSSDSKNLEVANSLMLSGAAKLSNFSADEMWAGTLTLSGFSVSSDSASPAMLKITGAADMTGGRIMAGLATVGFSGSVTPKLVVKESIEDSSRPEYFWNLSSASANIYDAQLSDLNTLAAKVVGRESAAGTESTRIFKSAVSNKNATASDFLNALVEIAARVSSKYNALNLE